MATEMLSRIAIKNFKSIGDPGIDLTLAPLTLLVGPNGAGKSSILEAIALSAQRGIEGHLVKFPSWTSILHNMEPVEGSVDVTLIVEEAPNPIRFVVRFGPTGGPYFEFGPDSGDSDRITQQVFQYKTFLISSVRGNVPYSSDSGSNPQGVGQQGETLLPQLALIFGNLQNRELAKRVVAWGERFGVKNLNAGFRGSGRIGSDYRDVASGVVLDLAIASSGARQMLGVITQFLLTPPGSLLMIEEPEISLHPKAQIDVLEMFAETIKDGHKQVLATTHSLIMVQALGYAVHKGWLSANDIAVYDVSKTKKGTLAKLLPLGKNGYVKSWVPSYSRVERELLREWAKTLPGE